MPAKKSSKKKAASGKKRGAGKSGGTASKKGATKKGTAKKSAGRKSAGKKSVARKGNAAAGASKKSTKKTAGKTATKKATKKSPKKATTKKAAKKVSAAGGAGMTPGDVFLINMIPKSLSAESNQDSEPHLSVNPTNPKQIVATAFTPDPGGGANAPIFVSGDNGNSWTLNSIVPSVAGSGTGTGDITTSLNRDASKLYAAILRKPTGAQEFLRANSFNSPTPMTVMASRGSADQPFTHALTMTSGADAGKDRLYIGSNDFAAPGGATATIDHSLNAGAASPTFNTVRIEKRTNAGQDGAQVRPVAHPDGTVYAVFYRWVAMTGSFGANSLVITSADVVVVRDDKGGKSPNPYTALVDPGDGKPGMRVAQGITFPFMRNGTPATGQQRLGGSLSIAVDPNNSSVVYVAWCDKPAGSTFMQTLHVRRSMDRGLTWSAQDILTIESATNAALAINDKGKVGLLFQQFRGLAGDPRWVTRLKRTTDGVNWDDLILANVSATVPPKVFDPYIGDYDHLVAVGKDFYGIFSTSNVPNLANFPAGVKYQRNADFGTRKLLRLDNTTVVAPSIDPFFFRITE